MNDSTVDYETLRRREYHRRWRAEHRESVRASQARYWTKKAAEILGQTVPELNNHDKKEGNYNV